jgi:hypothetical protein
VGSASRIAVLVIRSIGYHRPQRWFDRIERLQDFAGASAVFGTGDGELAIREAFTRGRLVSSASGAHGQDRQESDASCGHVPRIGRV